jgi:hypothetical protein
MNNVTTTTASLLPHIDPDSDDVANGCSLVLDCMRDGDRWRPEREAALLLTEALISNGIGCSQKERAEMLFGAIKRLMDFAKH